MTIPTTAGRSIVARLALPAVAAALLFAAAPTAHAAVATQIAVGGFHSCAIVDGGAVMCWGSNFDGQVGDGTNENWRTAPTRVVGIDDAVQLSLGNHHSCALLRSGAVQCWGDNEYGQLGDGSTISRSTPVTVGLAATPTAIAAGSNHTCVRVTGGRVRCWGHNNFGQVIGHRRASAARYTLPILVKNDSPGAILENVTGVSASTGATCATFTDNRTRCWGANLAEPSPVLTAPFLNLLNVTRLSGTCAVTGSGAVRCWGTNNAGQLGNGTVDNNPWRQISVAASGIASAVDVASGMQSACARLASGEVRCWGYNEYGQLGDGSTIDRPTPVGALGIAGASSVGVGNHHTCALLVDATVRCWGSNQIGQLGNGSAEPLLSVTPISVIGLAERGAGAGAGAGEGGNTIGGGDLKPRPVRPRNVTWRVPRQAKRPLTARFRPVTGVRYRIAVARLGTGTPVTRAGVCRIRRGVARCSVRVPTRGRWRATITPRRDGVNGPVAAKRFVVRG